MSKVAFLLWILVCSMVGFGQTATQGSLFASDAKGKGLGACPLKNTVVAADISGFLARVTVKQEFENSFTEPIEAVYVFPLSQNGAVDQMTMTVGTRVITSKIMRREEARKVYETAKSEGKTAALLDQERENIFTQSVANIMPGERVIVEISYVETLKYEDGGYEFVFPMTVGPRYIPGSVTDAAKIRPPVARARAGHDISIEVNLNSGVPVEEIRSISHAIDQVNFTPSLAKVSLKGGKTIPNKDFVLRYDVTGKRIEDAILTHRESRGGFFTLMLQPPDKIATEDRTPKEIVFVLDTSGSMSGFPIEKAKEAMKLSLDGLYPEDTFNLITFAGDTHVLFDAPVPATAANLERAQAFLETREGGGGTEMMKAIKAALDPSDSKEHLRIVCFMTDAYVGNDDEIVAEIQKHANARVFSFGIGDSVNRALLDRMAEAGRGEVEYVLLEDDGSRAAKKFYERVRTPLLTGLSIEWNGLPVADIYPTRLTDLFSAKPVIVHGRYTKAASGTIKLRGLVAGQPYEREIKVDLPESQPANDVLATLWARTRVAELSSDKLRDADPKKVAEYDTQITNLGLEFRLLTNFTSFIAVEDRVVNQNGKPVTIQVPVEQPEGVKRDEDSPFRRLEIQAGLSSPSAKPVSGGGGGGGNARAVKSGKAVSYGVLNSPPPATSGQGSGRGTGSGSGVGYGSGTGSGSGSGSASPAPSAPTNVRATVDVTGGSSAVGSSNATVGTTFTTSELQSLPLNSRSTMSLMLLRPGISTGDMDEESENSFTIDGTSLDGRNSSQLEGTILRAVRPEFPRRRSSKPGVNTIAVAFVVDTFGKVESATGVSGPRNLFRVSEEAARLTRFAPARADNRPIRLMGTLVYKFQRGKKVAVAIRDVKAVVATDGDLRLRRLAEKLHFWIAAVVGRLQNGRSTPEPNESRFVRDGKAEIQIELFSKSQAALDKLKATGFEQTTERGKAVVIGRIAIEKLAGLAEIDEVKLILPKI
ncbi:MAG: VIT domain-containing protein [Pyrinomonadaceae bacterium]